MKFFERYDTANYGDTIGDFRRDRDLYTCQTCGNPTEWFDIKRLVPTCSDECASGKAYSPSAPKPVQKAIADIGDVIQVIVPEHSSLASDKLGLVLVVTSVESLRVWGREFKGASSIWIHHTDYVVIGEATVKF